MELIVFKYIICSYSIYPDAGNCFNKIDLNTSYVPIQLFYTCL